MRASPLKSCLLLYFYSALKTTPYLRVDFTTGKLLTDSPGPEPNGPAGIRFDWH